MGEFSELTQDVSIFDDRSIGLTKKCAPRKAGKEMHWPKLALGDEYPVTDQDGRVLRYEKQTGARGLI